MSSSSVVQEPAALYCSLISHLHGSLSDPRSLLPPLANGSSSASLSSLRIGGFASVGCRRRSGARPAISARLSWGGSRAHGLWGEFNRFVRSHCGRLPISFASIGVSDEGAAGIADGPVVLEDEEHVSAAELDRPKRVLILMSDTGGGHRASAEAIKAAFHEEFGEEYQRVDAGFCDGFVDRPHAMALQPVAPELQLPREAWGLVEDDILWERSSPCSPASFCSNLNVHSQVVKGLMKYQPDIIISVHPLMQHVPLRILRAKGLLKKIVFTTVVTDLSTCHPTWFHKLVTRCYCPSAEVSKRALKAGLKPSQIKVYGLPVRPSFVKPVRPKVELKRELGMDEELPAVLLMGGGEGMGPIEATAKALADSLYDETQGEPVGQILVICGRNKKLVTKLQSVEWKIPVQVKGFITKMEECMGACDCIITKAGPGTIAEAMISGLPIILNDYIAGQEAGNVPYVVENGFGKFSKAPKEIAKTVAQWFGPEADELKTMSQNALRLARPDAVFKIVHDLHELVRQRSVVPQYSSENN
ncbi:hypothetical protein Taro_047246 [Colocasia esculenta]|uniref:monogalactosyldiacylglycerol synthase n=1 Tax=Colocasia esculenta TaxID=4460 RepID=A0A843WSB8_COLES|nr:hypothetical protein [Colocasia esculenta]